MFFARLSRRANVTGFPFALVRRLQLPKVAPHWLKARKLRLCLMTSYPVCTVVHPLGLGPARRGSCRRS